MGWAVAAAARGLHDEDVAGADRDRIAALHGRDRSVGVFDPVPAERAGLAAGHAERGDAAVAGQGGDGHGLAEPEPADAAGAAVPAARAAAAGPDPVGLEQDRGAALEDLGGGEP